ncbi:MAG TPA: DUF1428 domain-containing protein [Alphaproteobacteria bacterium]|nr:DUF1428 domain-containing protein [Alphaproteobacteria bacterium]
MDGYVDVFVLSVPKKNLKKYQKISTAFGKVIKKYGALEYREFVADDLKVKNGVKSFIALQKPKKGEVVVTALVGFKSKKHRDQVNKNVMKDPSLKPMMEEMMKNPIHDYKTMTYGGFKTFVNAFGK